MSCITSYFVIVSVEGVQHKNFAMCMETVILCICYMVAGTLTY